jgi:hypothetical protein
MNIKSISNIIIFIFFSVNFMTTVAPYGRLGNHFIRDLAISLLAKKHNLYVNYCSHDLIQSLGIDLFCGANIHQDTQVITDSTYFKFYNTDKLMCNVNPNTDYSYLQVKEIIDMIYQHLRVDEVKSKIMLYNPFNYRYNNNNDLYVHVRLGDGIHLSPGLVYYINAILNVKKYDKLYISTESPHHEYIQILLKVFPSALLVPFEEVATIQFASTCKHIILSHGSFSAMIGYLAFFSENIYFPEFEKDKMWYGAMFFIPSWKKLSYHITDPSQIYYFDPNPSKAPWEVE